MKTYQAQCCCCGEEAELDMPPPYGQCSFCRDCPSAGSLSWIVAVILMGTVVGVILYAFLG